MLNFGLFFEEGRCFERSGGYIIEHPRTAGVERVVCNDRGVTHCHYCAKAREPLGRELGTLGEREEGAQESRMKVGEAKERGNKVQGRW